MMVTHQMNAAIKYTTNIIQYNHRGLRREQREYVVDESNCILLLLSWCVNVDKEQGDVVTTY